METHTRVELTYGIEIWLFNDDGDISASLISSDLEGPEADGIESLILGMACAGIDLSTPEFEAALISAVDAVERFCG